MPVQIIGGSTVARANLSNITYSAAKLQAMPAGILLLEADGYRERWLGEGGETVRYYQIPWGTLDAARIWFLGVSANVPPKYSLKTQPGYSTSTQPGLTSQGGPLIAITSDPGAPPEAGGCLSRIPPAQDPVYPWLYCTNFELERGQGAFVTDPSNPVPAIAYVSNDRGGWAAGPGGGSFSDGMALIKATFRELPYEIRDDASRDMHPVGEQSRWIERNFEPAVEALPLARLLAANPLIFISGPYSGNTIVEPGAMLLRTIQVRYVWHQVPDPPVTIFDTTIGTINQALLYAGPNRPGFPAGTALFLQPQTRRGRSAAGSVTFTVNLRWLVRLTGWNNFPAANGNFYPAAFKDGSILYKTADHDALFQVAAPVNWQDG